MADFPELQPSTRLYSPGRFPVETYRTYAGRETRVRRGSLAHGHRLDLTFQALTPDDAKSIRDHYVTQQGNFASFSLPSVVWTGVSGYATLLESGYRWIYNGPPQVNDESCGYQTVSVSLRAVYDYAVQGWTPGEYTGDLTPTDPGDSWDTAVAGACEMVPEPYIPPIGTFYEGGYVGGYISDTADGVPTRILIVAPKASGETYLAYKTTATPDAPSDVAQNLTNGSLATNAFNDASHPLFQWASGLTINGYSDWYIPALREMEILYRNLKPSTAPNNTSFGLNPNAVPSATSNYSVSNPGVTSVESFAVGGENAFRSISGFQSDYFVSTENSGFTNQAFLVRFSEGSHTSAGKFNSAFGRAIRSVLL